MKWLEQIDPNFVFGLLAMIIAYAHNHAWRVQQASPPIPPTILPTGTAPTAMSSSSSSTTTESGSPSAGTFKRIGWLFLVVALVIAIACSASTRAKTLNATLATTDAARFAFLAYDKNHQEQIVANAPNRPVALQELDDYRAKRDKVAASFELAYRGIAAAALATDGPSLDGALQAGLVLAGALRDLGVVTGTGSARSGGAP